MPFVYRTLRLLLDTGLLPSPVGSAQAGVCGKEPSEKPQRGFFLPLPSQTQRRALCSRKQKSQAQTPIHFKQKKKTCDYSLTPGFCRRHSAWHKRVSAVKSHRKSHNVAFSRLFHPKRSAEHFAARKQKSQAQTPIHFKQKKKTLKGSFSFGRDDRIRTCDFCVPNAALYQTEPHLDKYLVVSKNTIVNNGRSGPNAALFLLRCPKFSARCSLRKISTAATPFRSLHRFRALANVPKLSHISINI